MLRERHRNEPSRHARTLRAAAVALGVSAAACRGPQGTATTVEFWALGREGEVVQELVPGFEVGHPGVRVHVQQIPWSAAHDKLLTAYVGRAMPDVMQLGNTWLPELVALGAIAPLDARLAASAAIRPDAYPEGVLEPNVVDGTTWGVPWYVDTRVLFYRSDLLRAAGHPNPPTTWSAWVQAMQDIRTHDPGGYAVLLPMDEWQTPVILALQRDAELLRDRDRFGNFESAPVHDAFAFYLDLFTRDLAPRAGAAQVANVYQDFASGYFALYVSGPWNLGEFAARLPASLAGAWATAPLPGPDAGHPGVSLAGGASLAVAAGSPHADAAWQWIEYLSEPAQQAAFYRLVGDLPARRAAWDAPELRDDPHLRAFAAQLTHVRSTPKVPEWERIASAIGEHVESAIRGRATLDASLAALDHEIDAILEKRRWMMDRQAEVAAR
jgi:multiple sugar transport system substrate-binding protein